MTLRIVTYTPRLHKEFFKVNKKLSLEKLTNPGPANRMSDYQCLSFLKIKPNPFLNVAHLTLSWRRSLSYKNRPIDLQSKSMDWFLHDMDLCHERGKHFFLLNQFLWQLALYFSVFVLLFWLIILTLANSLRKPPISSHYL